MCARFLFILAAGVCLFLPVFTQAEIVTSHLSSDEEMNAILSDSIFVAEGRIGDRGGSATHELDLGFSTSAPEATADYDWQNGVPVAFSLSYDADTGLVTFSVDGTVLNYITPYSGFGDLFIRTRANPQGSVITVYDIVIGGVLIYDTSSAAGNQGLDILWISGMSSAYGFTIEGLVVMSWTGAAPSQSNLAFQIKTANLSTVGVDQSSWGSIKGLYR
jgi:hypothetical protein